MTKSVLLTALLLLATAGILRAAELEDANEYFLTGQYQKAIPAYEAALRTAPDKARIYYNLGVCNEKAGNLERALYYYEQAGSIEDATTQTARLEAEIKNRKVARLKEEAQNAYDAMNYGVARTKAEDILSLDPQNAWAQGLLASISADAPATNSLKQAAETSGIVASKDTSPNPDTLPGIARINTGFPLMIGAAVLALVLIAAAFVIGRASNKITVERAILALIRLLPAGMLSIKAKRNLTLLFFEDGKVINTLVESESGQIKDGSRAAENLLKTKVPFSQKGSGPWADFADLVIELYRSAESKNERGNKKSPNRDMDEA
jgi:tetratricopeptide (TPR) repeat protein